jgi:endogenous inhibitor of DNA gyrase (YacG/DUF329 family)
MHTPPLEHPQRICPNCQKPYEGDPQFCPHCGLNLQPIPVEKFVAGSAVVDIVLGFLLCLLCAPLGITTIIPLITYFVMDRRYVGFRKGLAAGLILYVILILGALALCAAIIFAESNHH